MNKKHGQATIEYIAAMMMTVLFIGLLLAQIDEPIRQWWDRVAMKIAAPCPSQACVQKHVQPTVVPQK